MKAKLAILFGLFGVLFSTTCFGDTNFDKALSYVAKCWQYSNCDEQKPADFSKDMIALCKSTKQDTWKQSSLGWGTNLSYSCSKLNGPKGCVHLQVRLTDDSHSDKIDKLFTDSNYINSVPSFTVCEDGKIAGIGEAGMEVTADTCEKIAKTINNNPEADQSICSMVKQVPYFTLGEKRATFKEEYQRFEAVKLCVQYYPNAAMSLAWVL